MHVVKLVTFNIAHARGLSPLQGISTSRKAKANLLKIARLLNELNPDIVALQEVDENSRWNGSFNHLEYLREHTGYPYAVLGVTSQRTGRFQLSYGNVPFARTAFEGNRNGDGLPQPETR